MTWCIPLLRVLSRDVLKAICDLGWRKASSIKTTHQATNLNLTAKTLRNQSGFTLLDDSTYYPDLAPCGWFPVLRKKIANDAFGPRSHLVSKVSNLAEWSISMVSVVNFDLWLVAFSCKKVHWVILSWNLNVAQNVQIVTFFIISYKKFCPTSTNVP